MRTLQIEVSSDLVHKPYFKDRLTLKEIGEKLGYKSKTPIRRIFKEKRWETRKRWKDLDYDRVHSLYFEKKMSLQNVAKEMGLSSHYPIVCIFNEQGWKARTPHGRRVDMNPNDICKMYYQDKMTMRKIGEYYGYRSSSPISTIFREHGWNNRRTKTVDMDIDTNQVRKLYFETELSLEEVGRRIGKNRYALLKLFEKMSWRLRSSKCESVEEREKRKRNAQKRHHEKVKGLRDEIFGTECKICGEGREIIHRKDGKSHSIYLTNSLQGLKEVKPSEWVPLCKACHLDVHALMRVKTFEWESIKKFLRETS